MHAKKASKRYSPAEDVTMATPKELGKKNVSDLAEVIRLSVTSNK